MHLKKTLIMLIFSSSIAFAIENDYHQKPFGVVGAKEIDWVNPFISKVRLGFDVAIRYQTFNHENDNPAEPLRELSSGFSNANGNANMDFQLDKGISSYIEVYLSSEHHAEMWMREGYIFIDSLEMLDIPAVDQIMQFVSFKAGQMEINYGDYHLRRTDNGQALRNPFIGNYIIDYNTTEISLETLFDYNRWEAMLGISGGTTTGDQNEKRGTGTYAKLAYDHESSIDQRIRLSGSVYQVDHSRNTSSFTTPGSSRNFLYFGNRSGSPYKNLFNEETDAGQILPKTSQDVFAYAVNVLMQMNRIELFLNYDRVSDQDPDGADSPVKEKEEWVQYAIDLKYTFTPKFYSAVRYNLADHVIAQGQNSEEKVDRYQATIGYFLNPSILMKAEYNFQKYEGFQDKLKGGSFQGFIFEATVHF